MSASLEQPNPLGELSLLPASASTLLISYAGDISMAYSFSMAVEWLTTAEVAELSGYHVIYLRQLIRDSNIKARKFGPL